MPRRTKVTRSIWDGKERRTTFFTRNARNIHRECDDSCYFHADAQKKDPELWLTINIIGVCLGIWIMLFSLFGGASSFVNYMKVADANNWISLATPASSGEILLSTLLIIVVILSVVTYIFGLVIVFDAGKDAVRFYKELQNARR